MAEFLKIFLRQFRYTQSFGQFGEDALVQSLFRNTVDGTYVDVGAYHPILYSNTYALYRKGWSGIVIDPNPQFRNAYRIFRQRDTFENCAIGERGSRTYFRFSDGAYNTLEESVAAELQAKQYPSFIGTSGVASLPLRDIIRKHKIVHIDYMNVDVEGMDLYVLQSHDWSVPPTVISVEDSNDAIGPFLAERGYVLSASIGKSLVFQIQT